ncbi:hypothetical protein AJ85_12290 [Alkalihalobacillus alcalophilus ATCC 27647 = CGMCC 1.3604]|uniref:Helix-turn-helix domain-containing protein n=1 Tax=Alkalihalobacillus alcalophilus ATCC 27647 = CGMCC 1.3604 TaxID=1218173 RepID=A0A094WF27_ALKAL|nr:helix-turn-helix domain-containing protein [Alkalihalobacillus alcalophilus]KGA96349.1 hypothetical protein BALCAV_0216690 [Alkalihalobacillus alcalophilus ATCC 27647 = CGMCC 1.3604]MED1563846.1 helix-turn-helix domain-containing protein [Alkalihalobacillus alcalophilus]THG90173.1 hypothetical protein AJ85_12290 [Alkalihalobacillus alcalophilus ATCC 27647 = CGMCC 1.3604]
MEKHTRSKVKASLLAVGDTGNPKFKEDKLYYKPSEVSEKLGVSEEIIRRMFEKDKFKGARKTDGEHLRISKDAFITNN